MSNDPERVRMEYADERRYAARMAKQETATGPDPYDVVFAAVAEVQPRHVLEVGCGRGELAERMSHELSPHVIALDQSARMVELTAARGVEAIIGDVVDLPFRDGRFDCAVAAWMLYHASDLDRALEELRRVLRPDGRLVAATSSERNLAEVWELVGEIGAPGGGFTVESAGGALRDTSTKLSSVMSSERSRSTGGRRPTSMSPPLGRPRWPISCRTLAGRSSRPGASPSRVRREPHAGVGSESSLP